jgi:phosphotransferase system  glucose/maltose/N-acetylglucosamine-specific IIC component
MSSDKQNLLQTALDHARTEYGRLYGRLAMLESKAQYMAAVTGVLLLLFAALIPVKTTDLSAGRAYLSAAAVVTLIVALTLSLIASFFVDVVQPQDAEGYVETCLKIRDGATCDIREKTVSAIAELTMSYVRALESIEAVTTERAGKIFAAQVAVVTAMILLVASTLLPWVAALLSTPIS